MVKGSRVKQEVVCESLKVRLYPCDKCGNTYNSPPSLLDHKSLVHNASQILSCVDCDFSSTSVGELLTHFKSEHREPNISVKESECQTAGLNDCPLCEVTVSGEGKLMDHILSVHTGASASNCKNCGEEPVSVRNESLEVLQNVPDGEGKYSCPDCNHKVEYQSDLWTHVKSVHAETIDLPNHSDINLILPLLVEQNVDLRSSISSILKILERKNNQEEHNNELTVSKNKITKCLFCARNFTDIKKLQVHIKTKHNVKTDCLFCGKKNVSVGSLQNHVASVHPRSNPNSEGIKADKTVSKNNRTRKLEKMVTRRFQKKSSRRRNKIERSEEI